MNKKKSRYEKQSRKNWNYRNNCTTYFLLWDTFVFGNCGLDCTRRGTLSHFATLDGTMAVFIFGGYAGHIMVYDCTRL